MIFIKQITNEIGKKCVSLQVIKSYTTFVMTETDNNISDKNCDLLLDLAGTIWHLLWVTHKRMVCSFMNPTR